MSTPAVQPPKTVEQQIADLDAQLTALNVRLQDWISGRDRASGDPFEMRDSIDGLLDQRLALMGRAA